MELQQWTGDFLFPPPPTVAIPIAGSALRFPVHRVYCVGRNYAAHAVEMGHDPDREPPFFFQKSPDNLVAGEAVVFAYPAATEEVHYEVELVVALSQGGTNIPLDAAQQCVWGYAVGLDMTRRDLQAEAKKLGRPWSVAKAFEGSAPCSPLMPTERIGHPKRGKISLDVNCKRRQDGDLEQMIWKVPEIVVELSRYFELKPGDLVMTGTPAGVGPFSRGDILDARVEGVGRLRVEAR